MEEIELIDDTEIKDKECNGKGLVFRCAVNTYLSSHNSVEQRKSLRLLKRKSCECRKCTWPLWDDFLSEEVTNNEELINKCEPNKAYKLVISAHHDYEYGFEIDDVYFTEVK
jgi:hypothetical protein